jgi:hypothetical protein
MTKIYTPAEIAAFNATHTPARKVLDAQAKWTHPVRPKPDPRGDAAEARMEHDMLHGQDS